MDLDALIKQLVKLSVDSTAEMIPFILNPNKYNKEEELQRVFLLNQITTMIQVIKVYRTYCPKSETPILDQLIAMKEMLKVELSKVLSKI